MYSVQTVSGLETYFAPIVAYLGFYAVIQIIIETVWNLLELLVLHYCTWFLCGYSNYFCDSVEPNCTVSVALFSFYADIQIIFNAV